MSSIKQALAVSHPLLTVYCLCGARCYHSLFCDLISRSGVTGVAECRRRGADSPRNPSTQLFPRGVPSAWQGRVQTLPHAQQRCRTML